MAKPIPDYLQPVTPELPSYLQPMNTAGMPSALASEHRGAPRILKALGAGLAQDVIGLGNTAHNLNPNIPALFPNKTGEQVVGLTNPNTGEKIIEGIAQYAPYLVGEEALAAKGLIKGASELGALGKLGRLATTGGVFGATQEQNPYVGAALGAGANLIPGGVIEMTARGIPALKNFVVDKALQYAKPALEKNISEGVGLAPNLGERLRLEAFEKGKENYGAARKASGEAWNAAKSEAERVPTAFNREKYNNLLTQRIEELRRESAGQEPLEKAAAEASGYLQKYLNPESNRLESFADAIKHGKALNQDYRMEFKPNSSVPMGQHELDAIKYAKSAFKQSLEDQLNQPELESLRNLWNAANESTQELKSTFEQVGTPKGGINKSAFMRLNAPGLEKDPTAFVKDYLPKSGEKGITRFEQLVKVTGDEQLSKNILMDELFGKSISGEHLDTNKFLNTYRDLSEKQRDYLFPVTYRKQMDALSELEATNKGEALKSPFWYHTVPAIIGAALSHSMGGNIWEGGVLGYGAGKAAEAGLTHAFSNPKLLDKAVNRILAKDKTVVPPNASKALDYLQRGTNAIATPNLLNYYGGQ